MCVRVKYDTEYRSSKVTETRDSKNFREKEKIDRPIRSSSQNRARRDALTYPRHHFLRIIHEQSHCDTGWRKIKT